MVDMLGYVRIVIFNKRIIKYMLLITCNINKVNTLNLFIQKYYIIDKLVNKRLYIIQNNLN